MKETVRRIRGGVQRRTRREVDWERTVCIYECLEFFFVKCCNRRSSCEGVLSPRFSVNRRCAYSVEAGFMNQIITSLDRCRVSKIVVTINYVKIHLQFLGTGNVWITGHCGHVSIRGHQQSQLKSLGQRLIFPLSAQIKRVFFKAHAVGQWAVLTISGWPEKRSNPPEPFGRELFCSWDRGGVQHHRF